MRINTTYTDNLKAIEDLHSGDIFKYEGEIYMLIDGNYEDNVVNLTTGETDELNDDTVVMLPTKEPELNIDFA